MKNACYLMCNRRIDGVSGWIYPDIVNAMERHVTEYGVTEFLVGNVDDFDKQAQEAAVEVKRRHPEIKLTLVLHYVDRSEDELPAGFAGSLIFDDVSRNDGWNHVFDTDMRVIFKVGCMIIYSPCTFVGRWSFLELARQFAERDWIKLEQLM